MSHAVRSLEHETQHRKRLKCVRHLGVVHQTNSPTFPFRVQRFEEILSTSKVAPGENGFFLLTWMAWVLQLRRKNAEKPDSALVQMSRFSTN